MWVETIPTVGVWLGTFYLGYMAKMYTDEAGTHKGALSGGLWWWPLNWSNSGTKKPPCGAFQGFEYTVENHQYGRDMQMALRAHNTEWIHPNIMPKSFLFAAQQNK
ncbi:Oidioi.mRNA.OKI2018_I69.chr2.g6652.t1.cds [Oikopleura dioica]|uniref:Oidioi.mRNA.OKI2018_I69.chr2.g6652.t1.cds n=1 Tax=Oikopleura dioica TaxID=34765 RepID=A0ABN7TA96_OIKDI|nr:Oidioi.mRNA.OKI2018_I69.chr2.g6652.t1.cds [Oikopleura dioica]